MSDSVPENPVAIVDLIGLTVMLLLAVSAIFALIPDALGNLSLYFASFPSLI